MVKTFVVLKNQPLWQRFDEIDPDILPASRDEAKRQGTSHYFTGKRCVKMHAAPRETTTGSCCACKDINEKSPHYREKRKHWSDKMDGIAYLLKSAKDRAKAYGIEFSLKRGDFTVPEVCPVLGIPIYRNKKVPSDHSPTLDRVDVSKGYIPGNVEVISMRANRIKSDARMSELLKLVQYIAKHRLKDTPLAEKLETIRRYNLERNFKHEHRTIPR